MTVIILLFACIVTWDSYYSTTLPYLYTEYATRTCMHW